GDQQEDRDEHAERDVVDAGLAAGSRRGLGGDGLRGRGERERPAHALLHGSPFVLGRLLWMGRCGRAASTSRYAIQVSAEVTKIQANWYQKKNGKPPTAGSS